MSMLARRRWGAAGRRATAVAIATAAAIAGCAAPSAVSPSSTGSPTPAATSRAISESGFSTVIPPGWSDETTSPSAIAAVSGDGTVVLLLVAPDGGHIDARKTQDLVPDDQLASYLASVAQNGATNLTPAKSFDLGGATGVYITYDLPGAGGGVLEDQDMVVNHGGDTYDIVLNTAQSSFAHDLAALEAVLAAWHWR